MAIYPRTGMYTQSTANVRAVDIEAWTEQATQALGNVTISSTVGVRGTSEPLAIPLDEHPTPKPVERASDRPGEPHRVYYAQREPIRRDSLKRREALLKGKEGSRQRRRWENDRLLNNPWAQPPLPTDWEVHPTYPRHAVPYYLAPLWDEKIAANAVEERSKTNAAKQVSQQEQNASNITRELRGRLKKAKAARGLLQDLEQQVRAFVRNWEEKTKTKQAECPTSDSEDEEIVFVGRNGQMSDMPSSPTSGRDKRMDVPYDHLIFDSPANDHGANFGRWLVHNIATYYGLRTWSITVGNPARREAYVGIDFDKAHAKSALPFGGLPRPLYGMV